MSWFNDFQCIGGKCPLTCCITRWSILLHPTEIADHEVMEHPFATEILQSIDKETNQFKGDGCNRCMILIEDGWCKIVKECGEEYFFYYL